MTFEQYRLTFDLHLSRPYLVAFDGKKIFKLDPTDCKSEIDREWLSSFAVWVFFEHKLAISLSNHYYILPQVSILEF